MSWRLLAVNARAVLALLVLLVLAAAATGCASFDAVKKAGGIKDPEISIADIGISSLSLDGMTLQLALDVDNPNPLPLSLAGFDYALKLDGKQLLAGEQRDRVEIKARGSSRIRIPISLRFADLSRLLSGGLAGENLRYELQTAALVDLPVVGVKRFPASRKGEFPVPRPPTVSLTGIDIQQIGLTGARLVIGATLENPNGFGMEIGSLAYDLAVNGRRWAKSSLDGGVSLRGKGNGSISIPVELDFREMGGSLYQALTRGNGLNYQLDGSMKFAADHPLLKAVQTPFSSQGVLGVGASTLSR
ncbi:MAG TPA: hypothetical protein ENJ43_05865 [Gammaproteobacteria bacterium]|nr:hypothetical protein [Gammaproteobacteria bacterium]